MILTAGHLRYLCTAPTEANHSASKFATVTPPPYAEVTRGRILPPVATDTKRDYVTVVGDSLLKFYGPGSQKLKGKTMGGWGATMKAWLEDDAWSDVKCRCIPGGGVEDFNRNMCDVIEGESAGASIGQERISMNDIWLRRKTMSNTEYYHEVERVRGILAGRHSASLIVVWNFNEFCKSTPEGIAQSL